MGLTGCWHCCLVWGAIEGCSQLLELIVELLEPKKAPSHSYTESQGRGLPGSIGSGIGRSWDLVREFFKFWHILAAQISLRTEVAEIFCLAGALFLHRASAPSNWKEQNRFRI